MRSSVAIRNIMNTFMDGKKKQEMDYKQDRELKLAKELLAKTSLMIGRTDSKVDWTGI